MPTIQVLPPAQTGGGLIAKALGEAIGTGLGGALGSYYRGKQNERESTLVSEALKDLGPDADPLEVARTIIGLPLRPEAKKMYASMAVSSAASAYRGEKENRLVRQELNDRYQKRISDINADLKLANSEERKRLKNMKLALQKEQARNQKALREGRRPAFDILEGFGEGEDTLGGFEDLGNRAPSIPQKQPVQQPKRKLTEAIARHFIKQAGGDIAKAKEAAFRAGFE